MGLGARLVSRGDGQGQLWRRGGGRSALLLISGLRVRSPGEHVSCWGPGRPANAGPKAGVSRCLGRGGGTVLASCPEILGGATAARRGGGEGSGRRDRARGQRGRLDAGGGARSRPEKVPKALTIPQLPAKRLRASRGVF